MNDSIMVAGGLLLLIAGGEFLVRGAAAFVARLGMSAAHRPDTCRLRHVDDGTGHLHRGLDGVVVLAAAAAFVPIGYALPFDRIVGPAFVTALIGYLYYSYRQESVGAPAGHTAAFEKREALDEAFHHTATEQGDRFTVNWALLLLALTGLGVIVLGGKLLVEVSVGLARGAGISETVIGLTIVAIGTSLPELVTSIVAAFRGHSDVALGNILGSNIYNILGIGGLTALIAPTVIPPDIVHFDSLVMLEVSVALLACYGAYLYAIWPA